MIVYWCLYIDDFLFENDILFNPFCLIAYDKWIICRYKYIVKGFPIPISKIAKIRL